MSFLDWFKRKKKKDRETEEINAEPVVLYDTPSIRNHVITLCEQMTDLLQSLDEVKRDYEIVTAYLNDIQVVEGVMGEQKSQILDTAMNISKLTVMRNQYLNTEKKISDEVFNQMQEQEAQMPKVIKQLKENEALLDGIKRDMSRLSAEKLEWSLRRDEAKEKQETIRRIAKIMLGVEGVMAILIMLFCIYMKVKNTLIIAMMALVATVTAVFLELQNQECISELKRCDVNQNHVIALENHVKIKFVNMKNAVDYCCHRYHVKNSYELTYHYEQFIEATREREKLKETNADLEYFSNKLVRLLRKLNLYDAKVWVGYADALVMPKEMVELKHELFSRRQKLREQIEYNLNEVTRMREEVEHYYAIQKEREQIDHSLKEVLKGEEKKISNTDSEDKMELQIRDILKKVDEIYKSFM